MDDITGEAAAERDFLDPPADSQTEPDFERDDSDEDEVVVLGADAAFTPEQLAAAEATFKAASIPGDPYPRGAHVLPLYAMLRPDLQRRVFSPAP